MKSILLRYLSSLRGVLSVDRERQLRDHRVVYCGDHVVLVRIPNGRMIYLDMRDASVAATIALGKAYEPHVVAVLRRFARPGDVFFDVGANFGYHSLMLADLLSGDDSQFHLFEPNPVVRRTLMRSVHVNALWNRVVVNQVALSDRSGTAELRVFDDLWGGASLLGVDEVQHAGHPWLTFTTERERVEVPTMTLDDYCTERGVRSIDLMKLDVEGHEGSVVDGMSSMLEVSPRLRLVMEFTPGAYDAPESLFARLSEAFVGCYLILGDGSLEPLVLLDQLQSRIDKEYADVVWSMEKLSG